MKKLIMTIIIFSSYSVYSQTEYELKKYVTDFLSRHDPRIHSDTLIITEDIYHIILLQKIKSTQISIYKFAFNSLHSSTNFILIIDNKKKTWKVFGQNDSLTDFKSLTDFFSNTPKIKKSVIIRCYRYLIDNSIKNQGKWEKVPN